MESGCVALATMLADSVESVIRLSQSFLLTCVFCNFLLNLMFTDGVTRQRNPRL